LSHVFRLFTPDLLNGGVFLLLGFELLASFDCRGKLWTKYQQKLSFPIKTVCLTCLQLLVVVRQILHLLLQLPHFLVMLNNARKKCLTSSREVERRDVWILVAA
jgi:hypothetical protein